MPRTAFQPEVHGFHFGNHFINQLARLPGGRRITSAGRCGGMSYAALDCFHAGRPIPSCTASDFQATVPPDGTALADYIWRRQIDSLLVATSVKFLVWSFMPDGPLGPLAGVSRWTWERELPRLRASIDAGRPAVLVLIQASGARGMMLNHQVVAVGYDEEPAAGRAAIQLYDSNHPDQEAVLWMERGRPGLRESTGEAWRGFHVHHYRPKLPPDLAAGI
jgi:hypothetical protein